MRDFIDILRESILDGDDALNKSIENADGFPYLLDDLNREDNRSLFLFITATVYNEFAQAKLNKAYRTMDRDRCPLYMADEGISNAIMSAFEEWCDIYDHDDLKGESIDEDEFFFNMPSKMELKLYLKKYNLDY